MQDVDKQKRDWYIVLKSCHSHNHKSMSPPSIQVSSDPIARLTGVSDSCLNLRSLLQDLSVSLSDVALVGEPGTGKGLVARILHDATFRDREGTFVAIGPHVDDDELRVILFDEGRKRLEGVFGRRIPLLGNPGTLFLRNIHELSIISQTRLARFLIQQESRKRSSDNHVRVIIALQKSWDELAEEKMVIESLDKYLRQFHMVRLAPLRHRKEDIPILVFELLREICDGKDEVPVVDIPTMQRLRDHIWYDNVQELKSVLRDAVHLSTGKSLVLPPTFLDEIACTRDLVNTILAGKKCHLEVELDRIEQTLIRRALTRTGYDRARAASLLGMSDLNLRYRLRKFNMDLLTSSTRQTSGRRNPNRS